MQVKTTSLFADGRWLVMLVTRGGNRSWSGVVKRFGAHRCDGLFALAADGRRWFIPARLVEGTSTTGSSLGGPKCAAHEVERGRPFAVPAET